uniref:Uncharacterized protein n=1 Tax=Helianthus annuus TaxID=4232 RepID=A0A251TUK7_HELAN
MTLARKKAHKRLTVCPRFGLFALAALGLFGLLIAGLFGGCFGLVAAFRDRCCCQL